VRISTFIVSAFRTSLMFISNWTSFDSVAPGQVYTASAEPIYIEEGGVAKSVYV